MVDLSVKIGSLTLQNPIMPASGTFSAEFSKVIDLNRLGALVAKTVSRDFRAGNPPPRVSEIDAGITGFASVRLPILTERSTIRGTPAGRTPVLRRTRGASRACR
jgi:hypothetical protein